MNPDYPHDSNATSAEYRAGNVALMNMGLARPFWWMPKALAKRSTDLRLLAQ